MHISNRTLIEIASAGMAVGLLTDAYLANARSRKAFLKASDKYKRLVAHLSYTLERNEIPYTEFDEIVFNDIIHS